MALAALANARRSLRSRMLVARFARECCYGSRCFNSARKQLLPYALPVNGGYGGRSFYYSRKELPPYAMPVAAFLSIIDAIMCSP